MATLKEIKNSLFSLKNKLEKCESVIEDNSEKILFVGDVHGDSETIEEVMKIEKNYEKVIFLGDFVDRGKDDVKVISSFEKFEDEKFVILPGNHDVYYDVYPKDFDLKLIKEFGEYGKEIEILYKEIFSNAPICYYNKKYNLLAIHGFIPNDEKNWNFRNWKKPKEKENVGFEILWNDPIEFSFGSRGPGTYVIESEKTEKFFEKNKIKFIVRSHFPRIIGIANLKNGKIVNFGSSSFYGKRAFFVLPSFEFLYY